MLANSSGNFETLITQLLIEGRYIQAMKKGLELYQIKQFKIDSLPPNKIAEMYHVITTKYTPFNADFTSPNPPNPTLHGTRTNWGFLFTCSSDTPFSTPAALDHSYNLNYLRNRQIGISSRPSSTWRTQPSSSSRASPSSKETQRSTNGTSRKSRSSIPSSGISPSNPDPKALKINGTK